MTRWKKWLIVPAVAVIVILALLIAPGDGFQWTDPPPTADSLALEAQRKLSAMDGSCPPVATPSPAKLSPRGNRDRNRGRYIVIDTHTNKLYLRTADSVLFSALCSTGTGAELIDTGDGRHWRFDTPKGLFHVDSRLTDPWWRKPDWAFIEEGKPIPKNNSDRLDAEVLGDYAMGFGDGYFIHGTIYERLIGVSVTHGCVRLRSDDVKHIYESAPIGTPVVIF